MPELDLIRELTAARTHYEERFGWPVTIEVSAARLVIPLGAHLDAVVMPGKLGTRVQTELRIALLAGPVLADTGGEWWMFLTGPKTTVPKDTAALACAGVHLPAKGALVVIPREIGDTAGLPWIERPRPLHQLPPWAAVLAVTRRVAAMAPRIPAQRAPNLIQAS